MLVDNPSYASYYVYFLINRTGSDFMAHLSIFFCRELARARRDKGMTQSALAHAVGCKQSAISMLESGQPEKLSQETVGKIATLLGVTLESQASLTAVQSPLVTAAAAARGFCPNAECYASVPYAVQGELRFWPRLQPLADGGHCRFCGELLESRCPQCGAPVSEGACCPACGAERVTNTLAPETPSEAWAAQRRQEIAEWKSLLS